MGTSKILGNHVQSHILSRNRELAIAHSCRDPHPNTMQSTMGKKSQEWIQIFA